MRATAISIFRPRRKRRVVSNTRTALPAIGKVPMATASLLYFAMRVDQQLAELGPGRRHLIALRRRIRAELQLREGLLLTVANSGLEPRRNTRPHKLVVSRDWRLAAMFGGAGLSH